MCTTGVQHLNVYIHIFIYMSSLRTFKLSMKKFLDSCLETKLSEALATKRQIPYKDRILFIEFAKVSPSFLRSALGLSFSLFSLLLSLDSKTTVWDASKKLQLDECWRATVTQCLTNALSSSHHGNGKNRSRLDEAKELFPSCTEKCYRHEKSQEMPPPTVDAKEKKKRSGK